MNFVNSARLIGDGIINQIEFNESGYRIEFEKHYQENVENLARQINIIRDNLERNDPNYSSIRPITRCKMLAEACEHLADKVLSVIKKSLFIVMMKKK